MQLTEKHSWISRTFPFGLYMLFIGLYSLVEPMVSEETTATYLTPLFYTLKISVVIIALAFFRKSYDELSRFKVNLNYLITTLILGVVVFVLWVNMDWPFATMGEVQPYDPHILPPEWFLPFIIIRLFGTSVIVPIFEELFWRSFILRYIINSDFRSVKLGSFSWPSFVISSILFGLEHNLWLAGIVAGIFYNLLLYRTKNLWYCILAHGITNLLLAIYVIKTGSWQFW